MIYVPFNTEQEEITMSAIDRREISEMRETDKNKFSVWPLPCSVWIVILP